MLGVARLRASRLGRSPNTDHIFPACPVLSAFDQVHGGARCVVHRGPMPIAVGLSSPASPPDVTASGPDPITESPQESCDPQYEGKAVIAAQPATPKPLSTRPPQRPTGARWSRLSLRRRRSLQLTRSGSHGLSAGLDTREGSERDRSSAFVRIPPSGPNFRRGSGRRPFLRAAPKIDDNKPTLDSIRGERLPGGNKTPEQTARVAIDNQLNQSGWVVQNRDEANLSAGHGVAIRRVQDGGRPRLRGLSPLR